MKNALSKAIHLATVAHHGQFDKQGMPYILHVLAVMANLRNIEDEDLMCIAALHDVVEDTYVTLEDLRNEGFSDRVVNTVSLLTKEEGYSEEGYLNGILSSKDAILVKLADLEHNMDIKRLKGIRDKDMARLQKYTKMYHTLKEALKGF